MSAPRGYIDPNFENPGGPNDAGIIIYGYTPNFLLCVLALTLFTLALLVHTYQTLKQKTYFLLSLLFSILLEIFGYASRSLSAKKDPYNVIYFILQYFFIVTAPVFLTASIYVCLNKLIAWARGAGYTSSKGRWLRPKLILWGFVACDVLSTGMQVAGAALIGKAESDEKDPATANNILLAGLAFQTFAFFIFLVVLGLLIASLVRDIVIGSNLGGKRTFVVALYVASLLIFLRIIFRVAETSQGVLGYLSTHEAFFGALEFAPVVLAVWILAIWHPGRCIVGERGSAVVSEVERGQKGGTG
ncbi:hypothetical protein E2P81_ATG01352 [Venturia nashicola]|nr:hypothetical protein E2P81_ATG01352 [Venturia nashicola]